MAFHATGGAALFTIIMIFFVPGVVLAWIFNSPYWFYVTPIFIFLFWIALAK